MSARTFQFDLKAALFLMLVCGALLGGVRLLVPTRLSPDQIAQIVEGMAQAEVLAKLGRPQTQHANVWTYRYYHEPFHGSFFIRFDSKKKVEAYVGEIDNFTGGFPPQKSGRNSEKWTGLPD